ncbi:hypothetical protein [Streptomyces acidiscabies]|uniref:hypothetical protein n=1 Tax=Streptomyces acidiscabies TaxID=42234 RepID=UPI0015BAF855|nr:hypothetical protein [Streptomyces acidiscabies]
MPRRPDELGDGDFERRTDVGDVVQVARKRLRELPAHGVGGHPLQFPGHVVGHAEPLPVLVGEGDGVAGGEERGVADEHAGDGRLPAARVECGPAVDDDGFAGGRVEAPYDAGAAALRALHPQQRRQQQP